MSGFGGAGAFSDGKYNITNAFGGTLYEYIGRKQAIELMEYVDEINMKYLHRMLHGDPDGKVYKFLSFAGSDRDIADPWYTGNFDATYDDVLEGCQGFLAYLREKGEI